MMFSAVYWAAHYELLLHHLNSLFIQKVQKSVNGALRVCCNLQKHILHVAVLRQTPRPRLCHAHLSQCWRAKLTALLSSWLISPAPLWCKWELGLCTVNAVNKHVWQMNSLPLFSSTQKLWLRHLSRLIEKKKKKRNLSHITLLSLFLCLFSPESHEQCFLLFHSE